MPQHLHDPSHQRQDAPNSPRRDFLKTMALSAAAAACPGMAAVKSDAFPKRPNVILILTDDQGYGDLACHGNPVIKTPNLDRLHTESVRLTDFHVSPTCAPTRAGLMTGRNCNRTGVWHTVMGRSLLCRDEVTMADVFSAGGYATGIFGKWHLGDNYPFRPQDRGFQEVLVHGGGGVGQTPDFWGNNYFDDTYWHNGVPEKCEGYCTDVWFGGAYRFIETHRKTPFFCYIPTNAPHSPYIVDPKYSDPYKVLGLSDEMAAFYGMIANIDENVGRLRQHLEALGIAENTLLIFMTDNGTAAGWRNGKGFNAGMAGAKGSEMDGGHRVPCFMHWPAAGLNKGTDIGQLAAHVDLLPTLIDLCGLDKPASVMFDGISLSSLLLHRQTPWPERALVVDSQRIEHPEKWRACAVMTQRWRLINGKALFDMQADSGQTSNVAELYPEIVTELRGTYEEWWADVSTSFDDYCEVILGSAAENPVRLNCMDWHTDIEQIPWNQPHVLKGLEGNGFWAVHIETPGTYRFELRRWPEEADTPITGACEGGRAIPITEARLKIGDVEATAAVAPDDHAAVFELPLQPGSTRLQTWFTDTGGTSRGAYYVTITRME